MLLHSSALSAWPAVTELYCRSPKKGRAVRVTEKGYFINSYRPIDCADLRIELTAYDSIDASTDISDIPLDVKPIPIEVEDESTQSSIQLTFDRMEAFTHQASSERPSERLGQLRASGRVAFGTPEELLADWVSTWRGPITQTPTISSKAPFSRSAPSLVFDVLDDTGFLLEQLRGDVSIDIPVDRAGKTPSRRPTWLVDLALDVDDYSAPPARAVARIEDD